MDEGVDRLVEWKREVDEILERLQDLHTSVHIDNSNHHFLPGKDNTSATYYDPRSDVVSAIIRAEGHLYDAKMKLKGLE